MVTIGQPAADHHVVVWLWVLGGLVAWLLVAAGVAVLIGRSIRLADERTGDASPLTADLPATAPARARAVRTRRRGIPLPPIGVALAALAVGLEGAGYVTRLTGQRGQVAQLLSMDAPFSVPRLFVALLFAAAALAAVAGASNLPGRRTWWLAVGLVGGLIATVKAGSTVHAQALGALEDAVGTGPALTLSAAAAAVVIGGLWLLSRTERRDRRRVLGVLALYAVASVGLSALSAVAAGAEGVAGNWAAAATFVEESGEALAGVAFLVAVLVGVAPRLVLPEEWVLRRELDARTLDVPDAAIGRSRAEGSGRG
ncbi:hypothetical protein [Blastococcus deserti]|uniref:Uncharacterized protein n=1 Tax=Blastococcus deserti TaxID=2259033 RepID=A0ABW4XDU1_9ACTN